MRTRPQTTRCWRWHWRHWTEAIGRSALMRYVRTRPWLTGALAGCLVLLGLIVFLESGPDEIVSDDIGLESFAAVRFAGEKDEPHILDTLDALPSPLPKPQEPEARSPWHSAATIPTERPEPDLGVRPAAATRLPAPIQPAGPAWLTGTIEEILSEPAGPPAAPAGLRPFAR